MKRTQHKECVLVTGMWTTITDFQSCSNIAWLTSHKRLAFPSSTQLGGRSKTLLLDTCKDERACWILAVQTPVTGKGTCELLFFFIISLACFKKPETQTHRIADLNLRFKVAFFHFVVQLISLYYLMAVLFRALSKDPSVLIFRFEASSQTSGFV